MKFTLNYPATPARKIVRIIMSLAIIGLGLYYRNWAGALGLLTLASALTNQCACSLPGSRSGDVRWDEKSRPDLPAH
jgi:hypothetical protein